MKKITFLIFLLMTSFGFSQELVTNGDFQTGAPGTPWYSGGDNNPIEIVDQGGNFVFQANVQAVTDTWRVNLSQVVAIQDNTTYELSFDAYTDAATSTRTMLTSLGQAGAPFAGTTPESVALTDTPTTFTYSITTNFDTSNGGGGSRVIFDMGGETGFVFIDNVSLTGAGATCDDGIQNGDETGVDCGGATCDPCMNPEPMTAAPEPPARAPEDVISIYGDAYGTEIGLNNVPWDDPSAIQEVTFDDGARVAFSVLEVTLGGGFIGTDLGSVVDGTAMTHFHMDFWIADDFAAGQVFNPKWSNHTGGAGETDAGEYTYPVGATDSQTWVSLDIPLADFTNVGGGGIANRESLTQFLISVAGLIDLAYLDNVYLHNNMVLSNDEFDTSDFKVYPNPTNNEWNIKTNGQNISSVQVFDMLGKSVMSVVPNATSVKLDATQLPAGLYFARLTSDAGTKSVKLVKQ